MNPAILQRVELLLSQGRIADADKQIRAYLQDDPTNEYGRYLLAYIMFFQGDSKNSEEIVLNLQQEDPENAGYLALLTEINLKEEQYEDAEHKTDILLEMDPTEVQFYNLKSRVKFAKRYFDKALQYTNRALELDPENLEALNQKTLIAGMLGDNTIAKNTILEALERNPEDPHTIANHGNQLLREGKVDEALDRFAEALRLNPTNYLARYGMQEGMKSRFWLYKLFYKYFQLMGRLTANGSWTFVIGTYALYHGIRYLSRTHPALSPILTPLTYLILAFFILSWVINPLMNLYLMTNPYGRLLLDDDDKKMATYTGISMLVSLLFFGLYCIQGGQLFMLGGIFFIAMMIPLGTFLSPYKQEQRTRLTIFTIAVLVLGVLGLALQQETLLTGGFLGIFGYQFYMNSISISSSARRVE